jgi:hypothetical protein
MVLAARVLQQQQKQQQQQGAPTSGLFSNRQLLFVALAGEGWGYMGSKRLLWELSQGSTAVQGLKLDMVDQVGAACGHGVCISCYH